MRAKRGWVSEDGTDGTTPRERRNVLKLLRLRSKPWLQQRLGCNDTHPRGGDVMGIASAWLLSCKLLPLQLLASMISLQEGGILHPLQILHQHKLLQVLRSRQNLLLLVGILHLRIFRRNVKVHDQSRPMEMEPSCAPCQSHTQTSTAPR